MSSTILSVRIATKKTTILTNFQSLQSQKTSNSLDNLYVGDWNENKGYFKLYSIYLI